MANLREQQISTVIDQLDDETLDSLTSMVFDAPGKENEYHRKSRFPLISAGKRFIRLLGKSRRSSITNQSMYEIESISNITTPRKTTSLPVLDSQGISKLLYSKFNNKLLTENNFNDFQSFKTEIITLHKDFRGFGFSIKGGIDDHYIPGDPGIFVSQIHEFGQAHTDGRLSVGDRIIAVNGVSLTHVRHDYAASTLRNIHDVAEITVEKGAELRILERPTGLLGTTKLPTDLSVADRLADSEVVPLAVSESDIETAKSLAEVLTDRGSVGTEEMAAAGPERVVDPTNFANPLGEELTGRESTNMSAMGTVTSQSGVFSSLNVEPDHKGTSTHEENLSDDDNASVLSYATGTLVDDMPRTPKRPFSFLDPSSASVFTEILVVTTGVAALGAAIYFGYRFIKNR